MQRWARECNWGFFIGPDKAGSSWMQAVLQRHPTVTVPISKDLHFFNRFHRRGIDWYLRQFEPDHQTTTAVEVCHDYLFDGETIARIVDAFPNAKLVVCARHPAERAVSSYLYMVRQGRTRLDLSTALREIDELVDHGRYHAHLSTVLEHVGRDQVAVLDFAQLSDDPAAFKTNLLAGLGADPQPLSPEDLEPVRVAARPRSFAAARSAKLGAGLLRRLRAEAVLGRLKSNRVVERTLFRSLRADERPVLSSGDLCYLRTLLEPDTRALDAMLGTRFRQDWWHESNVNGPGRPR
jgi:Sulfotransferase family